ncbi:carbohydrate ABC transporter substrate-binding protein [Paenibacillus sp. PAMC21692]|uniref:carbohydrate ABC transporter substrate-binding protein n=1 Tax=Paenibacillus sp. PAMC21692 TaxID=2762320 RepID=UPI00164DB2CE|nr:carbohydrate ABC transporter substrate-binding protein [Paenibacillus sp. PAMC21692]QNK57957.1 carbohydrate ABC transporter substrate-binding protein [Paenibacillus sp. PAMC21692]
MRNWTSKALKTICLPLLSIALLAGCGNNGVTPSPSVEPTAALTPNEATTPESTQKQFENQELTVAVFEGGYGRAYWDAVVERFKADYPGVVINLISNPKIMDAIKAQIVAGNPPDVIYTSPDENTGTIKSLLKEGGLLELDDLFESTALDNNAPLKDKIIPDILEYSKPLGDGKIYYAPFYMSTLGLWYNQTLFAEKGWGVPKTWDAFLTLGETARSEGRSLFTYQGIYPGYNDSVILASIASAGGMEALDNISNYEEGAFKSDAVLKTFGVYDDIAKKGYLMPGTVALNHTQAQTEFMQGKALFIPNGNWFENEMKDAPREEGFEFGFLAPPAFEPGGQQYAQTSFEALFIPAKAKNPELAKEFIKYQYNDAIVELNAEKSFGVLAVKNGAEMAKPFIPESVYNSLKVFEEGVKPLIFQWKVAPKTEIVIGDEIYNPITDLMNGNITVDEWTNRIEKATARLRDAISKSK